MFGQPFVAVSLLRRAIGIRPVVGAYHLALGRSLMQLGDYDGGARELYLSWDIDRPKMMDLYPLNALSALPGGKRNALSEAIELQLIMYADCSDMRLMEFLKAITAQKARVSNCSLFIVETRNSRFLSKKRRQLHQIYNCIATFISLKELGNILGADKTPLNSRSFVIVSSCSCLPASDWLTVLKSYITTYPEIDLFQGTCVPMQIGQGSFIERSGYRLGLFPGATNNRGVLRFAHAANWACNKALLINAGGLVDDKGAVVGLCTLTVCVMTAGVPGWMRLTGRRGLDLTPP